MIITKNHPYAKKKETFVTKLSPHKSFVIFGHYRDIVNKKKSRAFENVQILAAHFKIQRTRPAKIQKRFYTLWEKLRWDTEVDFRVNIFEKRYKLTVHRWELEGQIKQYLIEILTKYPRAWYETYCAKLRQMKVPPWNILRKRRKSKILFKK